jgi:branched-chain amino acid transport system ATP-binding protein
MSEGRSPADPALLEVRGVRSGYGETEVLHGVSLRVGPGEAVVILGPNGHGKTTLLRTISGLMRVRSGEVDFRGHAVHGMAPDAVAGLGLVHIPQGDLLFGEMSVLENLLMGAYRAPAWAARAASMERVFTIFPRLAERRKQLARTLSGGERRMLAIGRGLMGEATLLMLDEPSLGLAPVVIDELYDRIAEIKATGLALLLVEEGATRVENLADRVFLLENGEIVREGPAAELLADPALEQTYLGIA